MRSRLLVPNTPASASSVADELARMTPRDLFLIKFLEDHQIFTTSQLADLLFSSTDRACRRASVLASRGVLDRFRRWVPRGSAPWHWTLGPVGAAILAAASSTAAPKPSELAQRRDRLAASPHLAHLIGTNGLFVQLARHARFSESAELVSWLSERQATAECAQVARPDGGGVWRENRATVPFWLEYDNSTEDQARVVRKLDGYAHLADTRAARAVLFWFGSATREDHFWARVYSCGVSSVTIATASAEYAAEYGGPAGAVWSLGTSRARVRLAELPAAGDGGPWPE